MSPSEDGLRRAGTRRVLYRVLFLNLAVSLAKLTAGIMAHSLAVISDGLHSSIDAINNVVGLVLLRLAAKEPDAGHPYGHGKIETLGAFSIAGFMFITCYEVGKQALGRLFGDAPPTFEITGVTFAVMAGTLIVNVFVVIYEKRAARRYSSEFLYADAVHTQSDVLVTTAVLAGLPFVMKGYLHWDAILALSISAFIAWSGFQVLQKTVPILLDAAAVDAEVIHKMASGLPRVVGVEDIRSRLHGGRKFVELTLIVTENDLREAHDLTERLEEMIMERYGQAEITIHYEPASHQDPRR
ncbi:MAG: cation diffusion facilitator family transporter [Vicinamibacteria bacterium]